MEITRYAPSLSHQDGMNVTGRGHTPLRRVKMGITQWGGSVLLSAVLKGKQPNEEGQGPLPAALRWEEHDKEGHAPPCCIKIRITRQGGGIPLPAVSKGKQRDEEGQAPPPHHVMSKWKGRDKEGHAPPHRIKMETRT